MPGNLLGEEHPSWSLVTWGAHSSLVNSSPTASRCCSLWHPAFPSSQRLSRRHPSSAPRKTAPPCGTTKQPFCPPHTGGQSQKSCTASVPLLQYPARYQGFCCPSLSPVAPHTHGNSEHTQRLKDNTLPGYGQNWICYSKLHVQQNAGEQIVIFKTHSDKPALSHMARKGLQLITDNWGKHCWTEASRLL